jgi:hypothetical protein
MRLLRRTLIATTCLDRETFIVEVQGGKQEVKEVLPALSAKK